MSIFVLEKILKNKKVTVKTRFNRVALQIRSETFFLFENVQKAVLNKQ